MRPTKDNYYQAVVVVSPMWDGEEKKDQDRAVWYEASQAACICDAVTSSPYGVKAADLAIIFSLVLFSGGVKSILRTLCNLLIALRAEKLHSEIHLPNDTPAAMQPVLQEVARRSIECSYQTTLVAAKFAPENGTVLVSVVRCGDSMFLAFDTNGQVLACYPANQTAQGCSVNNKADESFSASSRGRFVFGPGDQVLARVFGILADYPRIAEKIWIRPEHRNKWLVCQVLDKCASRTLSDRSRESHIVAVQYGGRLVVPIYLAGKTIRIGSSNYVSFPYSRTIRTAKNPVQVTDFHHRGAATAVLPDHFFSGGWTHLQDRFPLDAEFILCSDGFYDSFKDPSELWSWLKEHQEDIHTPSKRGGLIDGLHDRLRQQSSDDDISYVWVYPRESKRPGSSHMPDPRRRWQMDIKEVPSRQESGPMLPGICDRSAASVGWLYRRHAASNLILG